MLLHPQVQQSGHGCKWHSYVDAERWRYCKIHARIGNQFADLQLHGRFGTEYGLAGGHQRKTQRCDHQGRNRALAHPVPHGHQSGPHIDSSAPGLLSITDLPATGQVTAGQTVKLTVKFNEAVAVAGGTPMLKLNDGGVANYISGSGTNSLTFSYKVLAGQSTSALMASAIQLNGARIKDAAGNAGNLSLAGLVLTGPKIGTSSPGSGPAVVTQIVPGPAQGSEGVGKTVSYKLALSKAVKVAGWHSNPCQ